MFHFPKLLLVFHADDVILSPPEPAVDIDEADPEDLDDDFDLNDDLL